MLFIVQKCKESGSESGRVYCGLYKDMEDYWMANGSRESADYYREILETFEVPKDYEEELKHYLTFTKDHFTSSSLAKAFYFGLQCARNEKKILKARLDQLNILAGQARFKDTFGLHKEIEVLRKKLAELERP